MNGTIVVRAPASTANLGPGFDCAAAALDLWNELEVAAAVNGEPLVVLDGEGADELPRDDRHLALRAFALVAPLEGRRFRFVNRIPLERGLGSSAATVAAGLVAGLAAAGRTASFDELLELGLPLEGHADNLAAALCGGVCLIWQSNARRPRPPARRRPAAGGDRRRPEHAREHEAVALAAARVRCAIRRRPPPPRSRPCSAPRSPRATRRSSPTPSTTTCTSRSGSPTHRCSTSCAPARSTARPA